MTETETLVAPLLELHRWTVNDFHQIIAAGVLDEDDRIELINGVITQMSPIYAPHAACVDRLTALLFKIIGQHFCIRVQNPLYLAPKSQPQPDVAIVQLQTDGYRLQHPTATETLLVIEVSDSTLAMDRRVKAPLYAGAGIPEYWIVALNEHIVEQYSELTNNAYQTIVQYQRDQTLQSTSVSGLQLSVNAMLGQK